MDDKELEKIMLELLGDTGTSFTNAKPGEPSVPLNRNIPPSSSSFYPSSTDPTFKTRPQDLGVSTPSTPSDTSIRSIEPNGNVPLIGMRDYKTEALGFFMIDGKIYESIDDQLHGV